MKTALSPTSLSQGNPILRYGALLGFGGFCLYLFFWALSYPQLRDAEGFYTNWVCLPIAFSVGALTLGWGIMLRRQRFAFWLALALVGQAISLQLIDAGPALHYQHYKSPARLFAETPTVLLIFLALQMVLVIVGIWLRRSAIQTWVRHSLKLWQVFGIGLVFFLPVAAVSPQVHIFVTEVMLAAFVQMINLGNLILTVWALSPELLERVHHLYQRLFGPFAPKEESEGERKVGHFDRFVLLAAIWVTSLAATLSVVSYERHPHVTDEVAYLLHARFIAAGALTLPAPPVPAAFDFYLMDFAGDQWYAATPPGWPAMLAIGVLLGVPWLINPLLAGLNILLTYLLVQDLYDRQLARLTVILLCVSPWHIFMAMNFMTHTFTLTTALTAALLMAWSHRTNKALWAGLSGAIVGLGSIIRPLDGLIVAILVGLWTLGMGSKRAKFLAITSFGLGVIITGAAVLPYNQSLTGRPTTFPLNAYIDNHFGAGRNDYGFGSNRGFGWPLDPNLGHSPLDALINANLNSFSLNIELFGWSTGSLLLLVLAVFARERRRNDDWMIAIIATVFTAYFFYYYSGGPDFGARYWYLMLIPCVILTARGLQILQQQLTDGVTVRAIESQRATIAVGILCLLTLVNYIPWRAIDKYHHFWGMRPDIRKLAETHDFENSLILIRGQSHPDYTSAAIYNPLDLSTTDPIYAWDRDESVRTQLLQSYPERPVWLVDGPTITAREYRVVAGPLSTHELLATK